MIKREPSSRERRVFAGLLVGDGVAASRQRTPGTRGGETVKGQASNALLRWGIGAVGRLRRRGSILSAAAPLQPWQAWLEALDDMGVFGQLHALTSCYGRHRRPVACSN